VCCRVLQCVAVCCSVLQCGAVCCSVLMCVMVCCSALPHVTVCCSRVACCRLSAMRLLTRGRPTFCHTHTCKRTCVHVYAFIQPNIYTHMHPCSINARKRTQNAHTQNPALQKQPSNSCLLIQNFTAVFPRSKVMMLSLHRHTQIALGHHFGDHAGPKVRHATSLLRHLPPTAQRCAAII